MYRSRDDGSNMQQVADFALTYGRRKVPWGAWDDATHVTGPTLGQPVIADIEFTAKDEAILGLRDRAVDMRFDGYSERVPQGDILATSLVGDQWQVLTSRRDWIADDSEYFTDASLGSLAVNSTVDVMVASAVGVAHQQHVGRDALMSGVLWIDNVTRQPLDHEALVECYPCQPPIDALGDIESLCRTVTTPTPTAPPTATSSQTPTNIATLTPTTTVTVTPTDTAIPTATQKPRPIYLPAMVREACTPELRLTDLILVIDASTTMLEHTRAGRTKIDAAIAAASTLATDLDPGRDRLGLVWFNDAAHLELAPTFDRSAFRAALARMRVRELTRIELGIATAHSALTGPERRRDASPVLMLLTDGKANPGPEALALRSATEAKADGITLFTVGIGDRIDAASLRSMASSPADYFYAPDGEDLPSAYDRVRGALPCPPSVFWPEPAQRGIVRQ